MNRGSCANCGEPLPSWSRADRRTCSVRCRVARQRRASAAKPGQAALRTTSDLDRIATGLAAVTSALSRSELADDPVGVADEGTLLRLSSWLAEVTAEAALDEGTEPVASS